MVKVIKFIILASGLAATAFSLNQRVSGNKITSLTQRQNLPVKNGRSSFLMSSEEASPAPAAVEVVAAAPAPKKSFIDLIWNDGTKLTIYLAVWYLGNIFCKILTKKLLPISSCNNFFISNDQTTSTTRRHALPLERMLTVRPTLTGHFLRFR